MGKQPSETKVEETAAEIVPPPPRSWENWQEFLKGLGALQISELRLYTDVDFVAEAYNFGPYSFLNALAHSRKDPGALRPGIVLRAEWHLMADMRVPMETNNDHYHGGDLFDELTAWPHSCSTRGLWLVRWTENFGLVRIRWVDHGDMTLAICLSSRSRTNGNSYHI